MLCVRRWRCSAGRVRWWQAIQCREPKTGQQKQKVQVYYEDDPRCPSRDVTVFIYGTHGQVKD